MAWDFPEPSNEEGGKSGQAEEDSQIHINLSYEYTYSSVEGFELSF